MTDQPAQPSQPGDYRPPPASSGGYAPNALSQVDGGYSQQWPMGTLPKEAYTPWFTRVVAWLIDYLPFSLIIGIGFAVLLGTRERACFTEISEYDLGEFCTTGASTLGQVSALGIAPLIALLYLIWNLGYRQGSTGASVGKSILRFRLVSEKTGAPIGFAKSFVRELVSLIAYLACTLVWALAVLFPLWDAKRQSLLDKIFNTICLPN